MKVTIAKDARNYWTGYQMDAAKTIIAAMKEDESTPAEYLKMAAYALLDNASVDVINASAEIGAHNNVYWDAICEGSAHMDVLLTGLCRGYIYDPGTQHAYTAYVEITCWLSDVWQLGTDESKAALCRRATCTIFRAA